MRLKRVSNDLERVIDRCRVNGGGVKAFFLPALQDNDHALVPKGEMREERRNRPAVVRGAGGACIGKPT